MSLSGPAVSTSSWSSLLFWPHCIGLRVILIWGKFGVSYFELLLMFEIYAGHRLHAEKNYSPPPPPPVDPWFFLGFQLV